MAILSPSEALLITVLQDSVLYFLFRIQFRCFTDDTHLYLHLTSTLPPTSLSVCQFKEKNRPHPTFSKSTARKQKFFYIISTHYGILHQRSHNPQQVKYSGSLLNTTIPPKSCSSPLKALYNSLHFWTSALPLKCFASLLFNLLNLLPTFILWGRKPSVNLPPVSGNPFHNTCITVIL